MADLNGDGHLDLAVANQSAGTVSILIGKGDGTFSTQSTFPAGSTPTGIAVGDFDGDGRQDLVVTNQNAAAIDVFRGDGSGGFGGANGFGVGLTPVAVAVADLNGDGDKDLIVANQNADAVSVLQGAAGVTFAPETRVAAGREPSSVAVADFNDDGVLDLMVTDLGGVGVLAGTPGGGFGAPTVFAAGNDPEQGVVADFNGDGRPDVAVSDFLGNATSVLLGSAVSLATVQPASLAFGDQALDTLSGGLPVALVSTGDRALRQVRVTKTGDAADFILADDGCTGAIVPGGTACTVRVRFSPIGLGARGATMHFATDADLGTRAFDVALTGSGISAPAGPPGPTGPAGPTGGVGPTGGAGPVGPAGRTGHDGRDGAVGPPGAAGAGRDLLFAVFGLDRYRARPGRRVAIRFVTTVRSLVTVRARRGARVVRTVRAGRNRVLLRAPRKRGRYRLTLTAVAGAQRATDTATLVVR